MVEEGVALLAKPTMMTLPDWRREERRPLRESILTLENRLPMRVIEFRE
jgi:hypothetical protein